MKILHWRDKYGNEGHGEPIDDRVCDVNVDYLKTERHDGTHHWAESVPEQNNSEETQ